MLAAAILSSLRQADDESAQLGALTELCEMLSISSEDTLASFPIESAVPMLVSVLTWGRVGMGERGDYNKALN